MNLAPPVLLIVCVALGACAAPSTAPVGQQFFAGGRGLSPRIYREGVQSLRSQRFQNVVPQRLDFSCGAAALATVFAYYYLDPIDEGEIILSMLRDGDQDRIRLEGFSLLDMKTFADSRGYDTRGYRIDAEVLERLQIPAVTLVNTRGYSHFVVLKGAKHGVVYLADPALGHRAMRMRDFLKEWSGVVLFVAAEREPGTQGPLDRLEVGSLGPNSLVRRLDRMGLRNLTYTYNPLEF